MRELLERLETKGLLVESTFDTSRDVNDLYKLIGFDKLDGLLRNATISPEKLKSAFSVVARNSKIVNSKVLKSNDAQRAHSVLPVNIHIGLAPGSGKVLKSKYEPSKGRLYIYIGGDNHSALKAVDYDLSKYKNAIKAHSRIELYSYLTAFDSASIKPMIALQLDQWISDALGKKGTKKTGNKR